MGSFDAVGRSDAQLLAAHAAGDRYAFAELFGRHRRRLEGLARMTSRTREDADDAVQEAMLSAHRNAAGFRYDCAVHSWLHRIVLNACLDRLRRSQTQPTTVLLDDVHPVGDHTARVDTAIVVQRALLRLPVDQRAAVVAVDMHGFSVAETARMLGVAEGTVKSRCSRARAKLAESLADGGQEAPVAAPTTGRPGPRALRHGPVTHDWGTPRRRTGGRAVRRGAAEPGAHC